MAKEKFRDSKGRFVKGVSRPKRVTKATQRQTIPLATAEALFLDSEIDGTHLTVESAYRKVSPVRLAVDRIAANIAQAQLRLFDDNEREITGGRLFDLISQPSRFNSQNKLKKQIVTSWLVKGEFAVHIEELENGGLNLRVLNTSALKPHRATVEKPMHQDQVTVWSYKVSGQDKILIDADNIIYENNTNPHTSSDLDTLSPLESILTQVESYNEAVKFTKRYFENDTRPNMIIKLPGKMTKEELDNFNSSLENEFAHSRGGSHKTMVIASENGEMDIEKLQANLEDILLQDLQKMTQEDVWALFGIPSIFTVQSNAKYDSATEQISVFHANTLMPIMETITDAFQIQLVNNPSFMWVDDAQIERVSLSKSTKSYLTKAEHRNPSQGIKVILDPHSLPFASELINKQVSLAGSLVKELGVTPIKAAEFAGLEFAEEDFDREPVTDDREIEREAELKEKEAELDEKLADLSSKLLKLEEKLQEKNKKEDKKEISEDVKKLAKKLSKKNFFVRKALLELDRPLRLDFIKDTLKDNDIKPNGLDSYINRVAKAYYDAKDSGDMETFKSFMNSLNMQDYIGFAKNSVTKPSPRGEESRENFLDRCMASSEATSDFPDEDQRFAFCVSEWESAKEDD